MVGTYGENDGEIPRKGEVAGMLKPMGDSCSSSNYPLQ